MKLEDLKNQMLVSDEKFRAAYYSKDLKYNISQMVLEARMMGGVTQGTLAKEMGTKQPSIARVENGVTLPSLKFLEKMANALGTFLVPPVFGTMRNFHDEIYFNESQNSISSANVIIESGTNDYPKAQSTSIRIQDFWEAIPQNSVHYSTVSA